MPNPLLNPGPRATSTETQHAIEPIPEFYAGKNHPYRGTEQHGVPDTEDPFPEHDYRDARLVPVEIEPEPEPPINVRVINEAQREIDTFRVIRTYASADTARLLNAGDSRRNVTIRNLSANKAIYISDEPFAGIAFGFPIPANDERTFSRLETDVWAVSEDGSTIPVAIIYEYSIPVKVDRD